VRSPHGHARIQGIDAAGARAMPGVLAVFTGADLAAEGLGGMPTKAAVKNRDGSAMKTLPRHALARDVVRHVGDTVAMVVAETREQARDAAETLAGAVDYEILPAVTTIADATAPGAPQLFAEATGNVALDWMQGDAAAVARAFAAAHHVARRTTVHNRLVVAAMEPRGGLGEYDAATDRYTLTTPTQGLTEVHKMVAEYGLGVPAAQLRVVTTDVGGGFGMKNYAYPDQLLLPWAAHKVGRPVKWYAERADSFMCDAQARDHETTVEIALDKDGRFLAIRTVWLANLGAYLTQSGPFIPTLGGPRLVTGTYAVPAAVCESKGIVTNTVFIDAYRGAGKPEAIYALECAVDQAARELDMDPAELRLRNLVRPEQMPWRMGSGQVIDCGNFPKNLDLALQAADYAALPARKAASRAAGKLRGFGLSSYCDPSGFRDGRVRIAFDPSGSVQLFLTAQTNGQGHETTFAQILHQRLGVPFAKIRVVQGDSDAVGFGSGTGGSRSVTVAGVGILRCAEEIEAKGKAIAAKLLEAAEGDIVFSPGTGRFDIAGTDRGLSIMEVAKASFAWDNVPDGQSLGLDASFHNVQRRPNWPNGCHAAEVEIDPDTGTPALLNFIAVNDFGVVVNPMLLEAQVVGGIAQGIGQAMVEDCRYDPETGQLVTGSFMDYCVPRATDMPPIAWVAHEVPTATNPLGVKGCGEAGCSGSLAAIMNAVNDALAQVGAGPVEMPARAETIWKALASARYLKP